MKKINIKKCISVFIIALICCVPLYCGWKHYYNNYILVQNVFDHMYYAKAYSNIISEKKPLEMEYYWQETGCNMFYKEGYYYRVSYYDKYLDSPFELPNQEIISRVSSLLDPMLELEDYDISTFGGISIDFETTFESTIDVPYEDRIKIGYDYDVCEKTLKNELYIRRTYTDENIDWEKYELENQEDLEKIKVILNERGITDEDILKIRKWLLYDKVLTDWFKANEGKTRFSMDDLGKVEFIE